MASVQEFKDKLRAPIDRVTELADKSDQALSPSWEQLASQTGRLDLVSLLIAIVGLTLAIMGIFGFGYFRGQTYAIAKSTAEEVAEKRLTDLLQDIQTRLNDFQKSGQREFQPTSKPPTEGATRAQSDTEFQGGDRDAS